MAEFLPVSTNEIRSKGWAGGQADFVFVTGDAYIDLPVCQAARLCRMLESHDFTVAVMAQPDVAEAQNLTRCGKPRLGFIVSSGERDSMTAAYTASRKKRTEDVYSPGGAARKRPDYAVMVYGQLLRRLYPDTPIILCGREASLRRFSHFDFIEARIRRSWLLNAQADLLVYGDGERPLLAVAEALRKGTPVSEIHHVNGTVYKTDDVKELLRGGALALPEYNLVKRDKEAFAKSFYLQYQYTDFINARPLIEQYTPSLYLVQNSAARPLQSQEMDEHTAGAFTYAVHPEAEAAGGVPAFDWLKLSLEGCRGCAENCAHCPLTFYQGRIVQNRTADSLAMSAARVAAQPSFRGVVLELGGPGSAAVSGLKKEELTGFDGSEKFPPLCKYLRAEDCDYGQLAAAMRKIPTVKEIRVHTRLRESYLCMDQADHLAETVTAMSQPAQAAGAKAAGKSFLGLFGKKSGTVTEKADLCLVNGVPGASLEDALEKAVSLKKKGIMPAQVEDFFPEPGSIASCMFYTGLDPRTLEPVTVIEEQETRDRMRALLRYGDPANAALVRDTLKLLDKTELIGDGKGCLVPKA